MSEPLRFPVPESPPEPAPRASSGGLIVLPQRVPQQRYRPAQSNIPNDRAVREELKLAVARHVEAVGLVPPVSLEELREHSLLVAQEAGVDALFADYLAVLLNNATWRDRLATIPYERRLLLLPKCLRVEEHCPAPFDEFGLLCKECGLCSIQDLTVEAERLGYAVLVAEGSAIVTQMIEQGHIEAIVGVSCLNVLEKCFPHLEASAIPGISIPLLQDDCVNTTIDMEWVWDAIHLTSDDRSYRLDLDQLKTEVSTWFDQESLALSMGPVDGETERIAREWLARAGKRWRPYLSACVHLAIQADAGEQRPDREHQQEYTDDLKKLAVAVECFHKASLIHDDIEDEDQIRYQQASLHAEYGLAVALNVGDFLLGEGYRLIGELAVPAEVKVAMLQAAATGHVTLCRGQGAELCWTMARGCLSSLEVLDIFRQKTAPAFEIALRLGALFSGADKNVHEVLAEYSESLGIAYQIRDDIEDFSPPNFASEEGSPREISPQADSNDLRDLRPSLLLAIAMKKAERGAERELLESLWLGDTDLEKVETEVQRILSERGVTDKAKELLAAYEEQAVRSLRTLESATLKGLLRRVIGKIFGQQLMEGYCSEFEARNAASSEAGAESTS